MNEITAAEGADIAEQTGHSRHLRELLRGLRAEAGLTQQQVADRITSRLNLERPLTSAAVSEWERFGRHPPINVMAAWARVLGRRLVVQIDDASGDRVSVLLRRESADLARTLDQMSGPDAREVLEVAQAFARLSSEDRRAAARMINSMARPS